MTLALIWIFKSSWPDLVFNTLGEVGGDLIMSLLNTSQLLMSEWGDPTATYALAE